MKFEFVVNVYVTNPELKITQDLIAKIFGKVSQMSAALDALTAEVAAVKGVNESAIALIQGFEAKLNEIIAGGNNDPALVALTADLATSRQGLADAVVANPVPV